MRIAVVALLAIVALMPARATVSETVELDAGPGGNKLSPVWMMRCPSGERLVGLRVNDDGRIAGVRALCARVRIDDSGARWLSSPALLPEPPPPEPPRMETVRRVIDVASEGTVLHASSEGVTRQRTSRALIITIKRPVKPAPDEVQPSPRVEFRKTAQSSDLICPTDHVVMGLRTGTEEQRRGSVLRAVQIVCGDGLGRALEPMGNWPEPAAAPRKKGKRKAKAALPLKVQRIECGASDANPHDGLAARAVFGTEDGGRVDTIGLSCTGSLENVQPHSRIVAAVRRNAVAMLRGLNWSQRIEAPKWLDGADIATCAKAGRDDACAQESADRYCASVAGYERAAEFSIGRRVKDAVVPGGERCEGKSCRTFASITCAF